MLLSALGAQESAPKASKEKLRVQGIVERLSSDSFQEREKATLELWKEGETARESIKNASESDDPEIAKRASQVLKKIELQLTPETPAELSDLIQKYQEAPLHRKAIYLGSLRNRNAYFQVLKLYSMETDPRVIESLSPMIEGLAILGAREAIGKNDLSGAERLLQMSAKQHKDLIALAWVHRLMEQEGKKVFRETPEGVSPENWDFVIKSVKGDLEGALEIAEKDPETPAYAGLKLLTGDPLPWLMQNGFRENHPFASKAYLQAAAKKWRIKSLEKEDYAPFLPETEAQDQDLSFSPAFELAALGNLQEAEALYAKLSPQSMFSYFLAKEKIPEALKLYGIDAIHPLFPEWFQKRFDLLKKEEIDSSEIQAEILQMAYFLESRGMQKELKESLFPILDGLAPQNEEGFINWLLLLLHSKPSAPQFALEIAELWASGKNEPYEILMKQILGNEASLSAWRDWLKSVDPSASPQDEFRALTAFFFPHPSTHIIQEAWYAKFRKAVETSEEGEKSQHRAKIMKLAMIQMNVVETLKVWDQLDPNEKSGFRWNVMDQFLTAAGRWKEAAELLGDTDLDQVFNAEIHAYLAVTMRKGGLEQKAKKHEAKAEALSLGQPEACARLAEIYLYGQDPLRANEWIERAVRHSDFLSEEFISHLKIHARRLFEAQEWELAASCYEAIAHFSASTNFSNPDLNETAKARLYADLAKALFLLPTQRNDAIHLLSQIYHNFKSDGAIADDFFPLLRQMKLDAELAQWSKESWEIMNVVISQFPQSTQTLNTAGWLAARAKIHLPEAEQFLQIALTKSPHQAAYLDTMAEIRFAMGDRKGALNWSHLALMNYPLIDPPHDLMIRQQNQRFKKAPLPR